MNPVFLDPNVKRNMSPDVIIHLSKDELRSQVRGNRKRQKNKSRNNVEVSFENCSRSLHSNSFQKGDLSWNEHSTPLLPSGTGVGITRNSPFLTLKNKRLIEQSASNRMLNYELLKTSKQIIPAEYVLHKTNEGVERVLVPSVMNFSKPRKKLVPLRKLKKSPKRITKNSVVSTCQDSPPPLVDATIYIPRDFSSMSMDVDMLENQHGNNAESNFSFDILDTKKLFMPNVWNCTKIKTLNDRFTKLIGNFDVGEN